MPGPPCGAKFDPGLIDLRQLVFQPVVRQLVAVGAKSVGLDDLRAGFDISAVDLGHQGGLLQVQGVEALVETGAAGVQHGAHRAITQQR